MGDELDLRPMRVADAEALFAIYRDPAMWAYDPPRVHRDVEQTRAYCERAAARWDADGLSYWTARLAATGDVVGSGGAQRHRGSFWNLNYRIARPHQGRGLAGALLAAALAAAARADASAPCIAWIDGTNPASRRVAERGGLADRGLRLGAIDDVPRLAYADRALDDADHPPVPRRAGRPGEQVRPVPLVLVPAARWPRWVANFERSHGPTSYAVVDAALSGAADDGSTFTARLPFAASYDGPATPDGLGAAVVVPDDWGVLLVRKGGFAVARLAGATTGESKTGQRHVQGRTKAGGQSQQRFARRRDNQARQAYEAAADHAARILGSLAGPVVTGGDHGAVEEVLEDTRLRGLVAVPPWLAVPDPRRSVLEQAVADATALQVEVVNA